MPFRVIHRWFGLRSPTKSLRDLDPPYMNNPGYRPPCSAGFNWQR